MKIPPLPNVPGVQLRLVPSVPGLAAGDDGSIWSCRVRGRQRAAAPSWRQLSHRVYKGRPVVSVGINWKTKNLYLHRLVLEAFVGPCPPGMECRHFPDADPMNCRPGNLRWGTRTENMADRVVHGSHNRGERHPLARLTNADVAAIRADYAGGEYGTSIAKRLGIDPGHVYKIIRGKAWTHAA